jgi:hypothetical protein
VDLVIENSENRAINPKVAQAYASSIGYPLFISLTTVQSPYGWIVLYLNSVSIFSVMKGVFFI